MPKLNFKKTYKNNFLNKNNQKDFPGGPEADSELNAGGPGSIPGQETRPHTPQLRVCMLQLKFLYATTKTQYSEINKIFKKHHQIKANAKINKIQKFSYSVVSDSVLRPHGLQHAKSPCPSPTPGACSNSCPSSWWCHPTISSSAVPFSSCPQSLPASGSFPMSQFFTSGGQSIGASASVSVLPMNTQGWFPLGSTGLNSL